MDFQSIVVRILTEENNDLVNLAEIAGEDPFTFYKTANFRDADLSGEDLSQFDLSLSSLGNLTNEKQEIDLELLPEAFSQHVRMSAELSIYVHEILAALFPRRLSSQLEYRIRGILRDDIDRFLNELVQGNLRRDTTKALWASKAAFPKAEHRFAYTFSSELRDRIYDIKDEAKLGTGYVLSNLIYYVLLNDEVYNWKNIHPPLIEVVQSAVAEKYRYLFD